MPEKGLRTVVIELARREGTAVRREEEPDRTGGTRWQIKGKHFLPTDYVPPTDLGIPTVSGERFAIGRKSRTDGGSFMAFKRVLRVIL